MAYDDSLAAKREQNIRAREEARAARVEAIKQEKAAKAQERVRVGGVQPSTYTPVPRCTAAHRGISFPARRRLWRRRWKPPERRMSRLG